MATEPTTMRRKLETVFPSPQAAVLAEVITESAGMFVTASDFQELKQIVGQLAQAQARTEQRVEELAQAQARTEQRVEELAQAQARTEQRVEELAQAQARTEKNLENVSRELRALARQVGGLSEALGGSLESFAIDLVPEILEKHWHLKVEEVSQAEFTIGKKRIEVDLFIKGKIRNKPIVVLGEVKSNITESEVKKFLHLAQQLCRKVPELTQNTCRLLFFGYRANSEARQLIQENGAYMVFSHGRLL